MESLIVDLTLLDRQTDIRKLINELEGGDAGPSRRPAPARSPSGDKKKGMQASSAARLIDGGDDSSFTKAERSAGTMPEGASTSPAPSPAQPADVQAGAAGSDEVRPSAAQSDAPGARESGVPLEAGAAKDLDLSSLEYAEARKLWEGFVTYVRQKKVALGVCLISGTLKSFDEKAVMVGFARAFKFQREQVENSGSKTFLKKMMNRYFGRDLELVCFSEGDEAKAEREKLQATKGDEEDSQ
jgi:hypothetical protein